jgi:acetyltransferase-like isoleucine patch superfamily enzyme
MSDNLFFDKSKLKYLGKNVFIGKTVRIRHPERCSIGDNTIIDDFAYISAEIEIGKNCHIGSHVCISGGEGKFKMGDYSTLSSHVSVHCASSDYTKTSLDLPSVPREQQYGGYVEDVEVGNYVVVGSHSVILPGVKIPDKLACGAFTLLDKKEYEELGLYVGVPSRFLKRRIETKKENKCLFK